MRLTTTWLPYYLVHLLILFAIFSSALAASPGSVTSFDPWRVPKLFVISASAITSFSTGMTSLQLDMAETTDDKPSSFGMNMALRLTCSCTLGLLAIFYPLWFITHSQKARRFLEGICVSGAVCWLFVRLAGSPSGDDRDGHDDVHDVRDKFIWLDKLNLYLLVAVIAGILNAEKRVIVSFVGDENAVSDRNSEDDGCLPALHERDSGSGGNQSQRLHDSHELRTDNHEADTGTSNTDGRRNVTVHEIEPGFSSRVVEVVMGIV